MLPPPLAAPEPPRPLPARVVAWVKTRLLAGFLALFPIAFTAWFVLWLLAFLDGIIGRYIQVPGLGIVALFLLLLGTGALVRSWVGAKLFALYDALLSRVPIARAIYSSAKQLVEALTPQGRKGFQRVVLVEYPRRGVYAVGFVTKEGVGEVQARTPEHVSNVFLPTTPNPTSGVLLLVPQEQIIPLSMSVEDGIKLIVSGGLVAPEFSPPSVPPPPVAEPEGR